MTNPTKSGPKNNILSIMKNGGKVSKPSVSPKPKSTLTPEDIIQEKINNSNAPEWEVIGSHLIKKLPEEISISDSKVKIAAFDLDGTLIKTKSGGKFARGPDDWQWWNENIVDKLVELHNEGYIIVIFTNQGAVLAVPKSSKSYINLTTKLDKITQDLKSNGIESKNLFIYASPKRPSGKKSKTLLNLSSEELHDTMRKPLSGMWDSFLQDLKDNGSEEIDYENSFFIGDAAGRKKDFLDSDLVFAKNINLKFQTPDELFTNE